jgi:hypothetical protein
LLKTRLSALIGACLFGFACCFSIAGCGGDNAVSAVSIPNAQPSEYKARAAAADNAGPNSSAPKKDNGVMSRRRAAGAR